jgi:hypothetical protein
MISNVTTTTVSTVTTVTLAGSFALVSVLVLIALLVQKELTVTATNSRVLKLSKALTIGIVPLLIAFVLIVIAKVAEVLR